MSITSAKFVIPLMVAVSISKNREAHDERQSADQSERIRGWHKSIRQPDTTREFMRDALQLLKQEKALEQERLEILRREVMIGWEQARNGDLSERSVEQIAADIAEENDG